MNDFYIGMPVINDKGVVTKVTGMSNTQEHIKNCKDCGNGFYHQGLDVCQTCKVKHQSGVKSYERTGESVMNTTDQQVTPEEIKAHQEEWAAIAGAIYGIKEPVPQTSEDKYGALKLYLSQIAKWVLFGGSIGFILGWLF